MACKLQQHTHAVSTGHLQVTRQYQQCVIIPTSKANNSIKDQRIFRFRFPFSSKKHVMAIHLKHLTKTLLMITKCIWTAPCKNAPLEPMQTLKALTSLCIRAVWSVPLLTTYRIIWYCRIYESITKFLIRSCDFAGWSWSLLFPDAAKFGQKSTKFGQKSTEESVRGANTFFRTFLA